MPSICRDVARIAARDARGVRRVIGDQAAADLAARRVADQHAIAARKLAFDARDPRRQQALAAGERPRRAGVDRDRALRLQRAARSISCAP